MSDKFMVNGKTIKLDDDRSVFVGRADSDDECLYVTYKHGDQELKFKMSMEAADATQYLLNMFLDEIVGENKIA